MLTIYIAWVVGALLTIAAVSALVATEDLDPGMVPPLLLASLFGWPALVAVGVGHYLGAAIKRRRIVAAKCAREMEAVQDEVRRMISNGGE